MSNLDKSSQSLKSPLRDLSNLGSLLPISMLSVEQRHQQEETTKDCVDQTSLCTKKDMGRLFIEVNRNRPNAYQVCLPNCPSSSISCPLISKPNPIHTPKSIQQPKVRTISANGVKKRRSYEPRLGEKKQKVPHARSMELELAHMQIHNPPDEPYSARSVVRILEPPP